MEHRSTNGSPLLCPIVQDTSSSPRSQDIPVAPEARPRAAQDNIKATEARPRRLPTSAPMEANDVFRHVEGFGAYQRPRPPQGPNQQRHLELPREPTHGDGESEASHRIAHTLTACCRCRQVSNRCSPTPPANALHCYDGCMKWKRCD